MCGLQCMLQSRNLQFFRKWSSGFCCQLCVFGIQLHVRLSVIVKCQMSHKFTSGIESNTQSSSDFCIKYFRKCHTKLSSSIVKKQFSVSNNFTAKKLTGHISHNASGLAAVFYFGFEALSVQKNIAIKLNKLLTEIQIAIFLKRRNFLQAQNFSELLSPKIKNCR